jgi:hypothetical protein
LGIAGKPSDAANKPFVVRQKPRKWLAFAELPDDSLDDFTGAIIAGVTANVAFPTPPVAVAQLTTLKTAFETALAARGHGPVATAAKNNAREALIAALRKDANYVEIQSNNDLGAAQLRLPIREHQPRASAVGKGANHRGRSQPERLAQAADQTRR